MMESSEKRDESSRFLRNTQSEVFIYTDRFEVIPVRCRVRMYLVFVFPKGQYESKYYLMYNHY